MQRTICVLAVHFNNHEEVLSFVRKVRDLGIPDGWDLDIRVADNSGNWPEELPAEGFALARPTENLGYLNGCGFALQSWREEHDSDLPELVLVCNTDVVFAAETMRKILDFEWPTHVAAIGPDIRTSSGLSQNPFLSERPSRFRIRMLYRLFSGRWLQRVVHGVVKSPVYGVWQSFKDKFRSQSVREEDTHNELRAIYAAHGCAIFLTRSFFEAGCEIQLGWQMFGEEIHLAEQIRIAGLTAVWMPGARLTHAVSSTLSSVKGENIIKWRAQALTGLWNLYFR
ncbi:MAG: hypothetical protein KJO98_13990 [Rhodothermia bacterium]|nr:hypothetical protein [Rhodothermia bacterium]